MKTSFKVKDYTVFIDNELCWWEWKNFHGFIISGTISNNISRFVAEKRNYDISDFWRAFYLNYNKALRKTNLKKKLDK